MLIKLCGVEIYRGNLAPLSVDILDQKGETPLFGFNPEAVQIQGEDLVRLIEEMSRNGAIRIHPRSIKEF